MNIRSQRERISARFREFARFHDTPRQSSKRARFTRSRVSKLTSVQFLAASLRTRAAQNVPGMRASHGKMARGICERLFAFLVWMVAESRGATRAAIASESSSRLVSEKRKQKASLERSRVIKRALIEMKSDLKRLAGIRKSAKNRETACRNNGTIKN